MKIEAGMIVRRKDGSFFKRGTREATVERVDGSQVWLRGFGTWIYEDHLIPLTNGADSGPIRTVTRREIVPGTYGKINVLAASKRNAVIQLFDSTGTGIEATKAIAFTAEELREAAHLFSQLAEVLEESNANPR